MKHKKILITGASGKVGEAITRFLINETDWGIILLSENANKLNPSVRYKTYQVDLKNKKLLKEICFDERPDVIINCAAMTNVDGCEDEKELCWNLNVNLVEDLGSIAKILEAHLITISTDYIFDGKDGPYDENYSPNPLSYYGKSKLAAENYCRSHLDKYSIIRTNVVYGYSSYDKTNFIEWVEAKLSKGEELTLIDGQYCNPTLSDDIAHTIFRCIEKNAYGIYNAAGKDWMNRFEIALIIAETYGYDKSLINEVASSTFKQKAIRPEKGGLITLKAETNLGINYSGLENGLYTIKYQKSEYENDNNI